MKNLLSGNKIKFVYPVIAKQIYGAKEQNFNFWSKKLNWHIDIKRLKQFLDSFSVIKKIKLYNGTLLRDKQSLGFIKDTRSLHYEVITKPVKIMHHSIDISSIPTNSPAILANFIDKALLKQFNLETIEYLNFKIKELNDKGIKSIERRKCNFDVEIGRDMFLDFAKFKK